MSFDTSKLRGRIVEKYGTIGKFAEKAGCLQSTISGYLSGEKLLNQDKILKWSELLEIPENELSAYFFTQKVDESEQ